MKINAKKKENQIEIKIIEWLKSVESFTTIKSFAEILRQLEINESYFLTSFKINNKILELEYLEKNSNDKTKITLRFFNSRITVKSKQEFKEYVLKNDTLSLLYKGYIKEKQSNSEMISFYEVIKDNLKLTISVDKNSKENFVEFNNFIFNLKTPFSIIDIYQKIRDLNTDRENIFIEVARLENDEIITTDQMIKINNEIFITKDGITLGINKIAKENINRMLNSFNEFIDEINNFYEFEDENIFANIYDEIMNEMVDFNFKETIDKPKIRIRVKK
ncbi:MAG: hypothetical protein E7172_03080 [Firmicutes bacterium]|nr:hypothetical protein [Bacillota bacterium]